MSGYLDACLAVQIQDRLSRWRIGCVDTSLVYIQVLQCRHRSCILDRTSFLDAGQAIKDTLDMDGFTTADIEELLE